MSQPPAFTKLFALPILLSTFNIVPIANSDTAVVLPSGTLNTAISLLFAYSTSIWFSPIPAIPIAFSFVPASIKSFCTGVAALTTSIS